MTANDKYIYYSKTVTNSSNHVSTSSIICCADGWGEFSTYKKVTPAADANPAQKQWYEYDENLKVYQLTSDTEPVSQKSYYSKSDSVSTGFRITSSASAPEEIHCNAGGILSLAATKNFLLIGTTGGLKRTELKENIPSADVSKFPNNGNKISEEYIFFVFALNPSANEGEDDEYCNTTIHGSISGSQDSWDDAGLYAYYKNHGTWNRDGTDDNSTNGN